MEKYKADMGEEIEPQIAELISRAEKGTKTLQKKHQALQTKVCVHARQILFGYSRIVSFSKKCMGVRRLQRLIRGHNHAQCPVGRIVACKCS